jgi:hypothetical protein
MWNRLADPLRVTLAGGFHWLASGGDSQSSVVSPWRRLRRLLVLVNAFVFVFNILGGPPADES